MGVMPRRQTLALELTPAELRMLEQISGALGASPQDALRRLLREAYQRRVQWLESRAGFGFLELIPEPKRVVHAGGGKRPRPAANKKKAAAKKAAAKKAAARKAPTRKAPTRKAPTRKAAPRQPPVKQAPAKRASSAKARGRKRA